MEFYRHLKENAIYDFLEPTEYISPAITKYEDFKKAVTDIMVNHRRVLLYGDYDPDGLMCVLEWKAFFKKFDFNNYDVFQYRNRTHKIDDFAILEAIEGRYEYIIINDAGTNDITNINKLIQFGVKVILVDHHQPKYTYDDYPDGCVLINSIMENQLNEKQNSKQPKLIVSAGALVFILLDKVLRDYRRYSRDLSAYALCSLYADCIDMSSPINRGIYHMARNLGDKVLPLEIRLFLNKYTIFSRRFIEFHMTPKINSAFRNENFDGLNTAFLTTEYTTPQIVGNLVDSLTDLHQNSATLVNTATDIIYYENVGDFVVGNLNSVNVHIDITKTRLYNYTGLIANKLAERFKKPAVVYCGSGGKVKGSFRDILGRNYLKTFKAFSESEGHNAAFGIKLNVLEVPDFLRNLEDFGVNEEARKVTNEPIKVKGYTVPPSYQELNDMANYNEFAGITHPLVVIEVVRTASMKERPNNYGGYVYRWQNYNINSSRRVPVGCKMMVRPTVGKDLRLYAI